jgi:hypothetical protein
VRRDLAVPLYLRARAPGASVTSVALTEVQVGADDVTAYETTAAAGSNGPVFDYLWFSSRAEREDPCAGLALPSRATGTVEPARTVAPPSMVPAHPPMKSP